MKFFVYAMFPILLGVFFIPSFSPSFAEENGFKIELLYIITLEDTHLVHFNVCAEDESGPSSFVIVQSPQENKYIEIQKPIEPNTCDSYEVIIISKYADMIEITG